MVKKLLMLPLLKQWRAGCVLFCFLLAGAATPGKAHAQNADTVFLGRENWETPWVPDLTVGGDARKPIGADKALDVVILGDGYLAGERRKFEADVRDWYHDFTDVTPWKQFRGAFRVRAQWTPSIGRATPAKRSYYALPSTRADVGEMQGRTTRERVFDSLRQSGIRANDPTDFLRHTTVVMLVRTTDYYKPSGHSRVLSDPLEKLRVHVAFGNYSHHEFAHALVGIQDEYIGSPGKTSRGARPPRVTLFGNSNISYTRDPARLPWRHLLPGSPANPDPTSVIGLLWVGGEWEYRAWHSEPFCLMNGASSNWNLTKTARGADLRTQSRFCFWCEELCVATIWARTGQLGNGTGPELWKRWEEQGRPLYANAFRVPERISARNAEYTRRNITNAKIYERPTGTDTPLPDVPAPDEMREKPQSLPND